MRDARVLDLFAGTGALGLEAISRGARNADFVETRPSSLHALRANIAVLRLLKRTRVFKRDALPHAGALREDSYDVAFVDPPYGSRMLDRVIDAWRRNASRESSPWNTPPRTTCRKARCGRHSTTRRLRSIPCEGSAMTTVHPIFRSRRASAAALLLALVPAMAWAQRGGPRTPRGDSLREASRLDLDGSTARAREVIRKLVESAPDPAARAEAQRALAMSYAFDGDCANTVKHEDLRHRLLGHARAGRAAERVLPGRRDGERGGARVHRRGRPRRRPSGTTAGARSSD